MYRILFSIIFVLGLYQLSAQDYEIEFQTKYSEENLNDFMSLDDQDWFGQTVEGIGDLNGDGFDDFVVGANQDDDGGLNRGALYVFFMGSEMSILSVQKISDTEGGFDAVLLYWDYFGRSAAFLGDLNNDGKIEIAVGAEYDNEAGFRYGGIYILSLNTDGTVFDYKKINQVQGGFTGDLDDWDVFGSDISNIGDLNNDGIIDIAVGARRDRDGGEQRGAVWILFLNEDFTVNAHQKISATEGGLNVTLDFQDYFGTTITNLGDLDGDGVIDLAVGAYRDGDGGLNKGAVYVLFMNVDGTVSSTQKISELEGGFDEILDDETRFGRSLNLTTDINQDGKPDLMVGCRANRFYILNLNPDGTVDSFERYSEGYNEFNGVLNELDYFGFTIATLSYDLDNISFLVGAYGDSEFGNQKGAFWILELGRILSLENIDGTLSQFIFPNPTRSHFRFLMSPTLSLWRYIQWKGKR